MILLIETFAGYKKMENLIKDSHSKTWINKGVLNEAELKELRLSRVNITDLTYSMNNANKSELEDTLNTIREHHPGQKIWVEH